MTSNNNLISVIIPVYQVEPYLDRCVQSVLNQTYRNLEIILVDDGSPDRCPIMCDKWAERDSRIHVIHKENGGLSDARNVGMAAARGEYLAFVDSDDWINRNYLYCLMSAILTTGADIAACDYLSVSDGNITDNPNNTPVVSVHTTKEAMLDLSLGIRFRSIVWNKLYRSDLLLHESFPLNKYHEDEFFTYRIIHKCKSLAYINTPLYYYFQRTGSIMSSQSIRHLDVLEASIKRQLFFELYYPELYLHDKVLFCKTCLNLYIQKYDVGTAKSIIKKYRHCVHFSLKELRKCTIRECAYIIGTEPFLIGFTSIWIKIRRSTFNACSAT